jgi:hypothetical protein
VAYHGAKGLTSSPIDATDDRLRCFSFSSSVNVVVVVLVVIDVIVIVSLPSPLIDAANGIALPIGVSVRSVDGDGDDGDDGNGEEGDARARFHRDGVVGDADAGGANAANEMKSFSAHIAATFFSSRARYHNTPPTLMTIQVKGHVDCGVCVTLKPLIWSRMA